ncbi:hypothetical protein [Halocola ammonii]
MKFRLIWIAISILVSQATASAQTSEITFIDNSSVSGGKSIERTIFNFLRLQDISISEFRTLFESSGFEVNYSLNNSLEIVEPVDFDCLNCCIDNLKITKFLEDLSIIWHSWPHSTCNSGLGSLVEALSDYYVGEESGFSHYEFHHNNKGYGLAFHRNLEEDIWIEQIVIYSIDG